MISSYRACFRFRIALAIVFTLTTMTGLNPGVGARAEGLSPRPLDRRFGVAEGFRNAPAMAEIGAGWERVVLSWAQVQPDRPGDFAWLGRTLPSSLLRAEVDRGVRVAGLLQFTRAWAQTDPDHGERSVPPHKHPEMAAYLEQQATRATHSSLVVT